MADPGGDYGGFESVGAGAGLGYSANVPWRCGGAGDPEYISVWTEVVIAERAWGEQRSSERAGGGPGEHARAKGGHQSRTGGRG